MNAAIIQSKKSRLNCETAKYIIYSYIIWLRGQDLLKILPLTRGYKSIVGARAARLNGMRAALTGRHYGGTMGHNLKRGKAKRTRRFARL